MGALRTGQRLGAAVYRAITSRLSSTCCPSKILTLICSLQAAEHLGGVVPSRRVEGFGRLPRRQEVRIASWPAADDGLGACTHTHTHTPSAPSSLRSEKRREVTATLEREIEDREKSVAELRGLSWGAGVFGRSQPPVAWRLEAAPSHHHPALERGPRSGQIL